ncbi:ATP-dependent DNA helicase DinG [Litoribacillus peritrichatus]|uniref:ATP-dependent DNA helicase DinG n=1 Tax=Litoribacillus peritrichatus TaxID=718191 RepID=A0ABP7N1T2_9GAMM
MLTDALKKNIQGAYRQFLSEKDLKPRHGQKQMIAVLARTLGNIKTDSDDNRMGTDPYVALVEAGTGTGKTLSYLLSVIPIAKSHDKRIIISTATVALQEQIVLKDLPDVHKNSGLEFTFALAKGRRRYMCPVNLKLAISPAQNDQNMFLFEDEVELQTDRNLIPELDRLAQAFESDEWGGDIDDWPDDLSDEIKTVITTDQHRCSGRKCPMYNQCPFFEARQTLDKSDVIVANHDLVLSDLSLGGGYVLPAPEDTIYVFDEGHHLPDKAINHFSSQAGLMESRLWHKQLDRVLARIPQTVDDRRIDEFCRVIPVIHSELNEYIQHNYDLFEHSTGLPREELRDSEHDKALARIRFDLGRVPEELREQSAQIKLTYNRLVLQYNKLLGAVDDLIEEKDKVVPAELEQLQSWLSMVISEVERRQTLWIRFSETPEEGALPVARWVDMVEYNHQVDYQVNTSPIMASDDLKRFLWSRCFGAVVTSATLTALGKFDRYKTSVGLYNNAVSEQVMSPFDWQNAQLVVPNLRSLPSQEQQHSEDIALRLPDLTKNDKGSLLLFSSRRQLQNVMSLVPSTYREKCLIQGEMSKQELIKRHKQRVDLGLPSVLVGLASLAEGVDLPGDYCTHVMIARIPFAVPDDPVGKTLSEWLESRKINPFFHISVADASVKLVQACGRLLRSETDRGQITLMDRRIVTQRYGQALIDSLPPYRLVIE